MKLSYFPLKWKEATVVTIKKAGKPAKDVMSYRPISLLSGFGKIFERIILPSVQLHLDDNDIIMPQQFGFRNGKSCTQQLYKATKSIRSSLSRKMSTGVLAIDLKAAFDSVWHAGLVHKLHTINMPAWIVKLLSSYLNERYFRVKVGTSTSVQKPLIAGVPQGAVLAPTLFNIYIYDLPCPPDVKVAQFADDTIYMTSSHRTSTITRRLQVASNRSNKYFNRWRITINGSKSEVCLFTRKRARRHVPSSCVTVAGQSIEWKNSIKYLGVTLDKRLTFKQHIDSKLIRGENVIKAMYPLINRKSRLNVKLKSLIFKTIYRPGVLYGSPVFNHCAKTHKLKLQRQQNKLLKMILGVPTRTSTRQIHSDTNVEMVTDYMNRLTNDFFDRCRSSLHPDINELVDGT